MKERNIEWKVIKKKQMCWPICFPRYLSGNLTEKSNLQKKKDAPVLNHLVINKGEIQENNIKNDKSKSPGPDE